MKTFAPMFAAALVAFAPSFASAATRPAHADELLKASHHVITGKVLSVESKIQKSTIEDGAGNQDQVFTIKVKVEYVAKGDKIKAGEEITVLAWRPQKRIGVAAFGGQGHDTIPNKGDRATFYLPDDGYLDPAVKKGAYEPYMPNGITTKDILEPKG